MKSGKSFRLTGKVLACVAFAAILSFPHPALAQVGLPAFGSFRSLGFDTINRYDLNVHATVPILSRAGRLPFVYFLTYDSLYNQGWRQATPTGTLTVTSSVDYGACGYQAWIDGGQWGYWGGDDGSGDIVTWYYDYVDQSGTDHGGPTYTSVNQNDFGDGGSDSDCPSGDSGGATEFNDNSGMTIYVAPDFGYDAAIYFPDGGNTDGAAYREDANGNAISSSVSGSTVYWYDAVGGATPVLTITGSGTPASPIVYTYNGPNSMATQPAVTVSYASESGYGCGGSISADMPSSVQYPDSSEYTFTYSGGVLYTAKMPTGATITYTTGCTSLTRADDAMTGDTWSWSQSGGWTTETHPSGGETKVEYSGTLPIEIDEYLDASTAVSWTSEDYISGGDGVGTLYTTTELFGATDLYRVNQTTYDSLAKTSEYDESDWISTGPYDNFVRKTITSYSALGSYAEVPTSVVVEDGSGTQVAKTTTTYDGYGNPTAIYLYKDASSYLTQSNTFTGTGGISVATDVNGATTTYSYGSGSCNGQFPTEVASPVAAVYSTETWNCTGAVPVSVTDGNGATTTYGYTDSANTWRPTSIEDPRGYTTYLSYPSANQVEQALTFNGGSSTDDILATVDTLGRPYLAQQRQGPSATSFDTVETDYDVEGRVACVSTPQTESSGTAPGRCGTGSTTTTYDGVDRPLVMTDGGGGTTTYTYNANDVLVAIGPAPAGENTKQRQLEYDGIGRLASVCEVTSSLNGHGTCSQTNSGSGYWTKYTHDPLGDLTGVRQNAQGLSGTWLTRSFTFDGLGRMTQEVNPENGTTNYVFDTDTTCGTSYGDLVKRTDSMSSADVTCYARDAVHRITDVTYPSGGAYSSVTPAKHFVYDSATVDSTSVSNAAGRLAEAYTGSSGSKITDLGFSYTPGGRVGELWEWTTGGATWYTETATYYANGALHLRTPSLSGVPAITYALDGEGRPGAVSASAGTNPVSSVTNGVFGPTEIDLGSGDKDYFSYDSNTGRTSQYQFKVSSQTDTGTLTWNENGSLSQLVISNGISSNGGDSQTCQYGYDDLARIASFGGGSCHWGQTFLYDAFGNNTKSATSGTAFAAFYENNQVASLDSFSPFSDANGNLLDDPISDTRGVYSWDAEGRPVTIGNTTLISDALGRTVERDVSGGGKTETVYGIDGGKLATMNGSTLIEADVPLPGGGQAIYHASGSQPALYRHGDWLGSSRLTSTPSQTLSSSQAYAPFGEVYDNSATADPTFTGQTQDTVTGTSGLFDFQAREYSSTQSRWLSPDPLGIGAADPSDPQTWNRYSYVGNDPASLFDPLGLIQACTTDPSTGKITCYARAHPPCSIWQFWCWLSFGGGGGGGGGGNGGSNLPGFQNPTNPGGSGDGGSGGGGANSSNNPSTPNPQCGPGQSMQPATPAQGQQILQQAQTFAGTPYGNEQTQPAHLVCNQLVCHAVSMALNLPYGMIYVTTSTIGGSPYFANLKNIPGAVPQVGDVAVFAGHMGLANPQSSGNIDIYSATVSGGVQNGLAAWFQGNPTYFRALSCQ